MEQIYSDKLGKLGYTHYADIFRDWEQVKDEILIPLRKQGSGNGTIHVFLGAGDAALRNAFPEYYTAVEGLNEEPSTGAIPITHYFSRSNIINLIGPCCEYDYRHPNTGGVNQERINTLFTHLTQEGVVDGLVKTSSQFKLSMAAGKARPYFKNFQPEGLFPNVIRQLLLPQSAYKISLYKNDEGEFAAFWLLGFSSDPTFDSDPIALSTPITPNTSGSLQTIYFGAPGCGKSHKVAEVLAGGDEENIFRTTFHPDYDYASFVGCYKPEMGEGEIKYAFAPQVFTKAYVRAWEHPKESVYLIIEEINRGNCAQIFGDLFQLLDRKDDGTSCYSIRADKDLADYLQYVLSGDAKRGIEGGNLCLPPNLHIIATMNTSDQSLFPMDSAFKRRWDWEYIPINYSDEVKSGEFEIAIGEEENQKRYRWIDFLKKINKHILKVTGSEDKQMGNFFIKSSIKEKAFKSKVMAYLWHEVCKDEYGTRSNFFRSGERAGDGEEFSFNQLYDGEINSTKLLQGFMTYLDIRAIGEESAGEENE